MKRTAVWLALVFFLPFLKAFADNPEDLHKTENKPVSRQARPQAKPQPVAAQSQPAEIRKPVVIDMSRPSSGGHNRNFPSHQAAPAAASRPSYGQLQWNQPAAQPASRPAVPAAVAREGRPAPVFNQSRPSVQGYAGSGRNAAVAVHHHAYTQGYVRKKLQKIGVTAEPNLITDRSELIHTDRAHSTIRFPQKGMDKAPLTAQAVSPRHFNDEIVRDHMILVGNEDWRSKVQGLDQTETQAGHHYWHSDNGFNYCHFIDDSGYHWYGWYFGDQFFWTRDFANRWWWYDSDYDRWCFWNEGFWWWQDPYHLGDLYCYNDNNYIPCNSSEDQVVVTDSDNPNETTYPSSDGTRLVKVTPDTQDAFLYDAANPPGFDPVYLASGVESVSFSNTSSGRPLEIVLKLNDGTFDMFDGQGNAYNPGNFDGDQAADAQSQDTQTPSDPPAPPPDPGAGNP